jgi:hypothetical protein
MAQATAWPKVVTPTAAITPPTSAAPVSASAATAVARYPGGMSACPSIRAMTACRAAPTAAFSPAGILPVGLGTTVSRGWAAARSRAICSVRSPDGPTASTSSNSPG